MIYLISLIVGILNGMFAAGAGQVLVFYLVFIKKFETHKSRALSICVLSIVSIISLIGYLSIVNLEFSKIITIIITSVITSIIGAKIMKKIPANILNLVSGILIVALTVIKFFMGGK